MVRLLSNIAAVYIAGCTLVGASDIMVFCLGLSNHMAVVVGGASLGWAVHLVILDRNEARQDTQIQQPEHVTTTN
jgi:hypothetical protein